jgi:MSHA biogenesis protein MshI
MSNEFERHFRKFDVIDIPELCQRNLAALLPQDAKGVAFLMLRDDFAQLVLTRRGMLYVTRRFEFRERGELNGDSEFESNELPLDPQVLSLELQRSLDYYESQYDQTPIGDLVIAPADDRARVLAEGLRNETSLRVQVLDVREILSVYKTGEFATDWPTLIALGAALRTDTTEP